MLPKYFSHPLMPMYSPFIPFFVSNVSTYMLFVLFFCKFFYIKRSFNINLRLNYVHNFMSNQHNFFDNVTNHNPCNNHVCFLLLCQILSYLFFFLELHFTTTTNDESTITNTKLNRICMKNKNQLWKKIKQIKRFNECYISDIQNNIIHSI